MSKEEIIKYEIGYLRDGLPVIVADGEYYSDILPGIPAEEQILEMYEDKPLATFLGKDQFVESTEEYFDAESFIEEQRARLAPQSTWPLFDIYRLYKEHGEDEITSETVVDYAFHPHTLEDITELFKKIGFNPKDIQKAISIAMPEWSKCPEAVGMVTTSDGLQAIVDKNRHPVGYESLYSHSTSSNRATGPLGEVVDSNDNIIKYEAIHYGSEYQSLACLIAKRLTDLKKEPIYKPLVILPIKNNS